MQPFVFGGSYDSVAGNRLAYDQMAQQAAERDRQARADAFNQAQQQAIFQQRQHEEDDRQRRQQDYQFAQAAQAEQDRQNEMSRRAFEFGVTSKQHDTSESRIAQSDADHMQMQKDQMAENRRIGNEDADYREAVNRIDRGLITHPSDIDSLFPNLSTDQKARAASYWKEQNDKAHEDYESISGYAKAANGITKDLRTKAKKDGPMTEDEAYGLLAGQRSTAKWLPNLRFDENSQQWTPQMPKPFTVPPPVPPTADAAPTGFQIPFVPASARIPFPSSIRSDAPVVADAPTPAPVAAAPSGNGWQTALGIGLNTIGLPSVSRMFAPRPAAAPVASPAPAGFAFPSAPRMPIADPGTMPPFDMPTNRPVAQLPQDPSPMPPFEMPTNRLAAPAALPQDPAPMPPFGMPTNAAPVVDSDGMVRVKSPDGRTGRIPAAKFQAARAAGWVAVSDAPIQ